MRALPKLIEAARVVDHIFLQQLWSGNLKLYSELQKDTSALGKLRLQYFWLNKGPWSALDEHKAFLPQVPDKEARRRELLSGRSYQDRVRSMGKDSTSGRPARSHRIFFRGSP